MTLSVGQSIAIIAVCAACTFLERWLPWLLFGHRAVPKVVEYLGKILPMAVMVSLLVYCLRGMQFTSAGAWVPQVIAVGVTAGLHWWRRSTLRWRCLNLPRWAWQPPISPRWWRSRSRFSR